MVPIAQPTVLAIRTEKNMTCKLRILVKPCGALVILTITKSAIATSTQLAVVNIKAEVKGYSAESSPASKIGMLKVKQTIRFLGSSKMSAASKMAFGGQNNAMLPPANIHKPPSRVARYIRKNHAKMRAYSHKCNFFNVMIDMRVSCTIDILGTINRLKITYSQLENYDERFVSFFQGITAKARSGCASV
jgi:hypothetical protein